MDANEHKKLSLWLEKRHTKEEILALVMSQQHEELFFGILLKLLKNSDSTQSMQITWIMRYWAERNPKVVVRYIKKIMEILEKSDSDPIIRNLTGLIIDLGIPVKLEGRITQFCFKMLEEKYHAPAIHANALALLLPITKKYPELKKEVRLTIKDHPNYLKPSFQVRIKRFQF